ncbi:MAG: peptide ABC transporter substrate-binding protein [Acidimicrobiia bacterium]
MGRKAGALLLGFALVAGACASGGGEDGGPAADGQVSGGEFSVALKEPDGLLPANSTTVYSGQVITALFAGLVEYDPETAEPRNAMAESIESADQQLWTIKLKADWKFHNGEAVTAGSYVDAWNFAAYAPNGNENSFFFANVEGYDALQGDPDATPPVPPAAREMSGLAVVDDTTFTVRLSEPFTQFPLTLGYQAFYPMPSAAYGDLKAYEQAPIGNGPFMMDGTWRHDEAIRVKRFPGYAGKAAGADAVEFRIYTADDTGFRELQAGGLDIATSIPLAELPAARAEFGRRLVERRSAAFNYLGFNMTDPVFAAKKELRQAISLAIDRESIIDKIFNKTREPAHSVIAPLVPGSRPDACKTCMLDVARAKALLAQAGGFSGPLRLWFAAGQENEVPMEAIANQLGENLGITEVKFEQLQVAELKAKIKAREVTGPFLFNWLMDYPSPQSYLEPLYTSTSSSNRTGYANPRVDELIASGNRAPTLAESIKAYQAAEDVILDDMPVVPLWFGKTRAAHSERTAGVTIDPFSRIRVADVRVVG